MYTVSDTHACVFTHACALQVSLSIKAALVQFVYDKSLRISLRSKAVLGSGVVNNLQSNDAAKIWNIPQYGHCLLYTSDAADE